MPPSGDIKGNEFCTTPLSSSPFPPPNCFVPRYSLPPRFISPPGPLDASPLCRSPALEGFRYRSPVHSPNITSSPYRTPVPFGNSPVGMYGPNASFGTHSSGSFYGNYSGSRNLQRDGHKSWNGTPNNRHESGRGVKRNIPSFHQVNIFAASCSRCEY